MTNNVATFVRFLRERSGMTQEHVAEEIGVSRPTYVDIEKGTRELTISEAQSLSHLFGISVEDLLRAKKETVHDVRLEAAPAERKPRNNIRISVPQRNVKKFREVLLYLLEKVGAKPNIGETALYKLLYFIDFDYYEKFEEQLIGATYIKNRYGPTPIEFKKIVDDMEKRGEIERIKSKYYQYEQKKYLPLRNPDLSCLSARDLAHIDEVLGRLSEKSAKELSDYSHEDVPWRVHKVGEKISYESVFYRDHEHSVKNYDDEL